MTIKITPAKAVTKIGAMFNAAAKITPPIIATAILALFCRKVSASRCYNTKCSRVVCQPKKLCFGP